KQGVTTNKNQLGITLTVCTLFLVWEFLQRRKQTSATATKIDMLNGFILMAMAIWLFKVANSATSLVCTMFGVCGLVILKLPVIRNRRDHLIAYTVAGAL